jgi:putative DNA methylase
MLEHAPKLTKAEQIAAEVAKAIGAGRAVTVETVDFNDPRRPKTCLEVDFPILPVNRVAQIEGNAGKPIYQMSKWWARRRSSVFRSLLLASAMKAPDDPALAAKAVWDVYYANHQQKAALKHLKVADIFMGGGTTLVEGSRLGMQMYGTDLNPVAWFVVKNEFSKVMKDEVQRLLDDIEGEVKPQLMPFYICAGPNGEKGTWTRLSDECPMGDDFDPLSLKPEDRKLYKYEGPAIVYTFWAKHGPCQVTGCRHRTPIMTTPVMAVKTLSIKAWGDRACPKCKRRFDLEPHSVRMAPDVPLIVADEEEPFAVLEADDWTICPHCNHRHQRSALGKPSKKKKIELTLLVHPNWLKGSPSTMPDGTPFGGAAQDDAISTALWNSERARHLKILEVRGKLPAQITCPETGVSFATDKKGGTVPKRSTFTCGACGTAQDVLRSIKATKKTGPWAAYAIQGYSPNRGEGDVPYGGRFFAPQTDCRAIDAAFQEWELRRDGDLKDYWPRQVLPFGFMTHHQQGGVPNHGFTHWWTMFNPRQLLSLALLLKAIMHAGEHRWEVREYVLGAFQQYTRNQNMFCIWDISRDGLAPLMSNSNYHPKSNVVENSVFGSLGRGTWQSCVEGIMEGLEWMQEPWETASVADIVTERHDVNSLIGAVATKGLKVPTGDAINHATVECKSATDLTTINDGFFDLVVTDPPFGGLIHYSELADFFLVWLRLALGERYPDIFAFEESPKALEAVANPAREPENPDAFYQQLLTECWREANRVLKPGGLLTFTFHHSEDEPWVAVLEALFDAGFYLEATYPIRSDETKGEGAKPGTFGAQLIEYDIIHVCRKRLDEPTRVSWAKMRREVLQDVRRLQDLLENHVKEGLPPADIQVIRRGKALEYFSRHYGQVYLNEERSMAVTEALVGINQLIDEETGSAKEPPPINAEPLTRQFLRIFDGKSEENRDQFQKYLRGTGVAPDEYVNLGWCEEENKVFRPISPLKLAQAWHGRHRRNLVRDYDQALVLIGACFDNSGINAADTVKNENFVPRPSLKALLDWFAKRGNSQPIRTAAARAFAIYQGWERANETKARQLSLFEDA